MGRKNRKGTKKDYEIFRFQRPLKKQGFGGRDVILAGVILFVFAIGFFVARYASTQLTTALLSNAGWNDSINQTDFNVSYYVEEATETSGSMLDNVFFAVFIGIMFSVIVTSFLIRGHPIFMFFYFLFIVIGVILSVILADAYHDIITNTYADFGTTADDFTKTTHIIHYLPIYLTIIGIIGMIIMFGKPGLERIR